MQSIENTRGVDYVDVVASHRLPNMRFISGNLDAFDGASLTINGLNAQTQKNKYLIEWLNASEYKLKVGEFFVTDENGQERTYSVGQNYLVSPLTLMT